MLLVDAGGFFGNRTPRQQKARSKVVVDYMRTTKYDVAAIGEREMNYGLDFLLEQLKQGRFDAVCANLYTAKDSTLLFAPYVIKKVGGIEVGFLGLLDDDPRRVGVFEQLEGLYVPSYVDAARRYVPEVKAKADIVVALAHVGLANSRKLAELVPEVDIIIAGHGPDKTGMAEKIGETILVKAGNKSNSIGTLALALGEDNRITGFEGLAHSLKSKGRENADVARYVRMCEEQEKQTDRLLARRRYKLPNIPKQPEVAAAEGYLGWETCKACHAKVYERWSEDPHSKAFATLAEGDKWNDPKCLPCHTTGYEIAAQRDSTDVKPEMWNVQCEACHGMGTQHRRDGGMRTVGEEACRRCHTPEWSPDWNYEEALKRIDHGRDEVID
jgi:hypothetical protein